MPKVIGFYGANRAYGSFSNFYPARFQIDGKYFRWSEQYLMYQKAVLFGDMITAEQIMKVNAPLEAKKLGRQVSNFDAVIWETKCEDLFFPGLYAKFAQNEIIRKELLSTENALLCECAPRDRIWGIGMGVTNPDHKCPELWQGKNRLGKMLMRVRDKLQKEFVEEYARLIQDCRANRQRKKELFLQDAVEHFTVTGLLENTIKKMVPQKESQEKQQFIVQLSDIFINQDLEELREDLNRASMSSLVMLLFNGWEIYGLLQDTTEYMLQALMLYCEVWKS